MAIPRWNSVKIRLFPHSQLNAGGGRGYPFSVESVRPNVTVSQNCPRPMSGRVLHTDNNFACIRLSPRRIAKRSSPQVRGWVATETDPMEYVVTYTYSQTGQSQRPISQFRMMMDEISHLTYDADGRMIARKRAQ